MSDDDLALAASPVSTTDRDALIEECVKILDGLWTEIGAGMGWGCWTETEYALVGTTLKRAIDGIRALSRSSTGSKWQDAASAPRDGTPFLAWCPIIVGLGDTDATPDAELRIVWWEARGQFTSDRDLGNEEFTHWRPQPEGPR